MRGCETSCLGNRHLGFPFPGEGPGAVPLPCVTIAFPAVLSGVREAPPSSYTKVSNMLTNEEAKKTPTKIVAYFTFMFKKYHRLLSFLHKKHDGKIFDGCELSKNL